MVGAVLVIFAIGLSTLPASFSDETILVNQQIKIPVDFANTKSESQPFAYIVQITNDIGQVISVSYITGSLGAGQSLEQTLSYIPYEAGNYNVEKFLWSDLNTPTALTTAPVSNTITVVQSSEQQIQQPTQQTIQTELSVALSKSSYNENETIIISGTASSALEYNSPVTIQIVNSDTDIISISQVYPNSYGVYSYTVTAGGPLWLDSGIYQVLVQHGAEKTAKVFNYSGGTGVITPPPPPPVPEPVVVVESAVSTTTIQNAQGSSTPGCEPDCFIPRVASVERNALITFENNDSAAHTSTAGTPADGPSGVWDSSLIMNGQNYSIRLSNDGIYPYFCMVHPWMEGTIVVGDGNVIEEPVAIIEPEPEPSITSPALPFTLTTSSSDYRQLVDDTIVISGNVGNVIINEIEPYVTLQAFYENNEYFSRFVEVLPNGDFEEIEDIDFGGYGSIGTWTLKATYGDKTAETSFTISPQHGFISPTIYYEIVGSEFVMVLEKPVNYDQDYHTIRDFNEAANFSLLESFVTTEVNPIGALENIITSLHPYGDEAYDNLDSVQSVNRWNSDGTETNEYIEAWMTAVAISDLDNLSYQLIQLTNAGMSIEVAFDNQRPYYQNNQGGDMIGELNPSTPNNTILPLTFLVPLTPSSIPSSPPPVPEPSSSSNPMNATVENAQGSSTPGCEPDCFIPSTVTIAPGGMVTFANNDSAAHTSTAGTGADGPSGVWDSSLVMMGAAYTTPALDAGEYPYFCMVHPWMTGLVIVEGEPVIEEPVAIIEPEPEPEPSITSPALSTSECQALADQRGHENDDHLVCQFPFDITVYVGERVAWMETKTWAGTYYHTITSVDGFFDMMDMGSTSFLPSAWNGTGVYNYYDKLNPSLTGIITVIEESSNPMSVTVENAQGSSTPGCEPDCFIPSTVTIAPGGMVTFANNDSAAHTSTAGTGADGPSGVWDSSLVMMGAAYTTPALDAGEYPYFCMVHPWMTGLVIVE